MRRALIVAGLALPSVVLAQVPPPVDIPKTAAGSFITTFLHAYNSGDAKELEHYNAIYGRHTPPQVFIDLHSTTGRLTPVRVKADGPNQMTVLLAAENGDGFWQDKVTIDPANPMKVLDVGLGTADRPEEFAIPRVERTTLNAMMDRKLAKDTAADRFAGTIAVERHGKLIYQSAWGLADRAAKLPVTMQTKFRLGSANKMFTAVGILQLVQQGRVSLDAAIGTYIKDYPNKDFAKDVTIRQLLTHTGGAGEIFTPEYDAKRLSARTLRDYVAMFGARAPDTSKEGKNEYSNYGFVLLGRVIEVVSGEDYYDYVQRRIFAVAGMKDTASLPEDVSVPGRSHGYTKKEGKLTDNADTLPYRGSSAGGGYTTAADMIRFGNALLSGKLISKTLLMQASSSQRPDGWYGFGFWIGGKGNAHNWGHGGGAPGMNSAFRVYPQLDAIVVALSNLDPLAADNEADYYAYRMALNE